MLVFKEFHPGMKYFLFLDISFSLKNVRCVALPLLWRPRGVRRRYGRPTKPIRINFLWLEKTQHVIFIQLKHTESFRADYFGPLFSFRTLTTTFRGHTETLNSLLAAALRGYSRRVADVESAREAVQTRVEAKPDDQSVSTSGFWLACDSPRRSASPSDRQIPSTAR